MPGPQEPALETLTALGVTGERREAVIEALRTGTWTQLPWVSSTYEPPTEIHGRIGEAPHDHRYELITLLGHGTSGAVYSAHDHISGESVAIKILRRTSPKHVERMHREMAILRMLMLPGVVDFRDDGVWNDRPFIVMDLVEGERFPGTQSHQWDDVANASVALTEALARIHQAGVTHGDLKPSNVLTADGRPILLDFGLAQSDRIAMAEDEDLAGTPAYLAPEQFLGSEPGMLTDLYSLGAMLYEALAGRRPHLGETLHDIAMSVLFATPPALGELAPNVPLGVQQIVTRLLSREPSNRPQSATEVLRALRRGDLLPMRKIRRLGSHRALNTALEILAEGRSLDICGPVGSGRTRLVEDIVSRLSERGRAIAHTRRANSPLASLEPVIGAIGLEYEDLASATTAAEERLHTRLRAGVIVVADDADRLDPWTARLLESLRGEGIVIRTGVATGDLALAPLTASELEALFVGPEVIHFLRSDAAELLFHRAGSGPRQILDLLHCWIRAGIAHWEGERVHISREVLDRLRAGLRVDPLAVAGNEEVAVDEELEETWRAVTLLHPWATTARVSQMVEEPGWALEGHLAALSVAGVIREEEGRWQLLARPPIERWPRSSWMKASRAAADALPEHADERLLRLVESDEVERIPGAARTIAAHHVLEGRPGVAWAVLTEGLAVARREGFEAAIGPLLEDAVCVALSHHGARWLEQVTLEISRSDPDDTHRLGHLCALARRAMSGGGVDVRRELDEVVPFDSPDLELWRYRLAAFAGLRGDLDEYEDWVERASIAVADLPGGTRNAKAWVARVRYRQRRYAEAAALHETLYETDPQPVYANASGLNAAIAWMEAERFDDVERILAQLEKTIPPRRTPAHGASFHTVQRTLRYRRGELPPRDRPFEAALLALDNPYSTGLAFMNEAAICWRRGEVDSARQLADISAGSWKIYRRPWVWALARALSVRCGAPCEQSDLAEIVAAANASPVEEIALQTRALLRLVAPLPEAAVSSDSQESYAPRREVLSLSEAHSLIRYTHGNGDGP